MKGKGETKNKNHFFPFLSKVETVSAFPPNFLTFYKL